MSTSDMHLDMYSYIYVSMHIYTYRKIIKIFIFVYNGVGDNS